MPELPEVETVKRGLAPVMEGRRIVSAQVRRPDLRFAFPERFAERLTGVLVRSLGRRAKYLVAVLSSGEALIMHLGMSGRFTVHAGSSAPGEGQRGEPGDFHHARAVDAKHDHVVLGFEGGARVTFNDPRRFGYMDLAPADALDRCKHFAALGPEPLSNAFSPAHVCEALAGRRAPLKTLLLDQRIVAGLGNIYVCEALFRAGLDPGLPGRALDEEAAGRLCVAVREVLGEAIAAGGSSLRDHAQTDGSMGYFQHAFKVYGRDDQPCQRQGCGGKVVRFVQGGRSTFACERCQLGGRSVERAGATHKGN